MTHFKLYLRLLLALSVSSVLAQIQLPEEAQQAISSGLDRQKQQQQQAAASSMMTMFKDQAARQRLSQPIPTTTTTSMPTISASTNAATSQVTNQVPTIVATTTTTTTASPSIPIAAETTQIPLVETNKPPSVQLLYAKTLPKKCQYNNETYQIGARWTDDCESVCECVLGADGAAVSACRNRCPQYTDKLGENCRLVRSTSDECCLELVCGTEGKPVQTTTTLMNTERGPLSVTTTEVKLAPAATTSADASSLSTTTVAATTQQTRVSTIQTVPTQTPRRPAPPVTTVQVTQPAQTVAQTTVPTTRSSTQSMTTNPPTAVREPKQVAREPRDFSVSVQHSTSTELPTTLAALTEAEVDPNTVDLCIIGENGAYHINETWQDDCGSYCRCTFEPRSGVARTLSAEAWRVEPTVNLKANSRATEIICSVAPSCKVSSLKYQKPSAECQVPRWTASDPNDKCSCPQLICLEKFAQSVAQPQMSTLKPQLPATTPVPIKPTGCISKQNGRQLSINETFNDECHSTCQCMQDGQIRCQQLSCPSERAPTDECSEWMLDAQFKSNSSEGKCCAEFVCRVHKQKACDLLGKRFSHGDIIPEEMQPKENSSLECERFCQCNNGEIVCTSSEQSCPGPNDSPPEDFRCNGQPKFIKEPNECCPKWVCFITEDYALKKFSVSALNATSVEVIYVLPSFALGQRGRAELNYTSLPVDDGSDTRQMAPPENARWTKKPNIKTSDGYFHIETIKYVVQNLKPNHRYWFRLRVHFTGDVMPPLDEPLESDVQQVSLPPLTIIEQEENPIGPTTTTTTPLPPTRLLQPNVIGGQTRLASLTSTTAQPTTTSTTSTTQVPTTVSQPTPTSEQQPSSTVSSSTSPTTLEPTSSRPADLTDLSAPKTDNKLFPANVIKPDVSGGENQSESRETPCPKMIEENQIDNFRRLSFTQALTDQVQNSINGSLQRHAWHLLFCCIIMTVLFTIVLIMYLKKTLRVIAPISSQAGYDNPGFPPTFKSTNYLAHQKHSFLGVDENSQNYNNDNILAKQKNLEVDKTSPLHHHQMNDIHHYNGRQHLI